MPKIVSFAELVALPVGTIYSDFRPNIVEGLYRRGEVLLDKGRPIDFYTLDLLASCDGEMLYSPANSESRLGWFDFDAQFVVYDDEDRSAIAWELDR
jgi:hypothetical protein